MGYSEEQIKWMEQDEQDWREMECLKREVKQRIEKINFFKFKIYEYEKSIEDEEYNVRMDTQRLEVLGVSKKEIKSLITQIEIIKDYE
jgi:hypothetical protein